MSDPSQELIHSSGHIEGIPPLLEALRGLIVQARQRVLRAADTAQVLTYWQIGKHIVEFEQGGAARAAYGKGLLVALASELTADFGKGFDATNLRHMRDFYLSFPICDALRRELSWTHYRLLLRVDSAEALITAEPQKLEALKTHKKGLMQQLFPCPEEVAA